MAHEYLSLSYSYIQTDISLLLSSHNNIHSWDSCKARIKNYYKSISHSIAKKNKSAIQNISNRISKLQQSSSPNSHLISTLQNKLLDLQKQNISYLALRSRINWYEKGETPSKYFYQCFKQTQFSTDINTLYIPSSSTFQITHDSSDILNHCCSHFQKLWSSPPPLPSHSPLFNYIPKLSPSSINSLSSPITPDELIEAIKSKKNNSSPGPDGLPYKFYKIFSPQIIKIFISHWALD
jgi:hypothetical protein